MKTRKPAPAMPRTRPGLSRALALPAILLAVTGFLVLAFATPGIPAVFTGPSTAVRSTSPVATSSATAAKSLPDEAEIVLYLSGEQFHSIMAQDDESKKIIEDAIFSGMLSSMAYPGADLDALDDKIRLTAIYPTGVHWEYTVYEKGGRHVLQRNDSSLASPLTGAAYKPFLDLAMGYRLPWAMTVVSTGITGGATIHAFGCVESCFNKSCGVRNYMAKITPRELADHIEYITLGDNRIDAFDVFVGGRQAYGSYTVYDSDYTVIPHAETSGLEPRMLLFANAKPGKYVVELSTTYEEDAFVNDMRYFFGVIVP